MASEVSLISEQTELAKVTINSVLHYMKIKKRKGILQNFDKYLRISYLRRTESFREYCIFEFRFSPVILDS